MRAVIVLLGVVSLGVACGGGTGASSVPVPVTRVSLRFGRTTGIQYRYVARDQLFPGTQGTRLEGGLQWAVLEPILYVTEQADDSLDARLLRVRVDSSRAGTGGRVSLGPFPGFVGWFNTRRERIDTLASDAAVELLRGLVFNGTAPLPESPLAVGESWVSDAPRQIEQFQRPALPTGVRTRGTLKRLRVVEGDTLADLTLKIHIDTELLSRQGEPVRQILGDLTGTETFSVTRGISVHLELDGRIEVYASSYQVGALNETIERTLEP